MKVDNLKPSDITRIYFSVARFVRGLLWEKDRGKMGDRERERENREARNFLPSSIYILHIGPFFVDVQSEPGDEGKKE